MAKVREVHGTGDTFDVSWSHDGTMLCSCFSSGSLHVLDVSNQTQLTTSIASEVNKGSKEMDIDDHEDIGNGIKVEPGLLNGGSAHDSSIPQLQSSDDVPLKEEAIEPTMQQKDEISVENDMSSKHMEIAAADESSS